VRHALKIERVFGWDVDRAAADAFAHEMAKQHGIDAGAVSNLADATRQSDVVVTCTSSTAPYLGPDHIRPGTFIAAVGADNPEKSEILPELMAGAVVVADVAAQAITMGDTHHAIRNGVMTADAIRAELGELITGRKAGRTGASEITLFDSTGTGIQDVAAAARAYERAREQGAGSRVSLS
jgi:alanine dehydrogenase